MKKTLLFIFSIFLLLGFFPLFSDNRLDNLYSDRHYIAHPPSHFHNLYYNFQLHDPEDHILMGIHQTGKRLNLEEGSVFTVIPADEEVAKNWREKDLIRVSPKPLNWKTYLSDKMRGQTKHHKFTHVILKNMTLNTIVTAEYSAGPDKKIDKVQNTKHPYTQLVQHIDIHERKITLFNPSLGETVWHVFLDDLSILSELKNGDPVLIGVNEEYSYLAWKETYPHVMIFYTANNYIRVKKAKTYKQKA